MDKPENTVPEPIKLPEGRSDEPRPGEVIVISQATVYYFVLALLFFIAGFAVAWITFSTTTNSVINSLRAEVVNAASDAANSAVGTAVAGLPANSGVSAPPVTPTPVPKQNIAVGDAPGWGPLDAKVTIVEFSDFQCPYCEVFFKDTYSLIKQRYGDKVRFVFKHFPLTQIHPLAYMTSLAAECANEQGKFWEYHDLLFATQRQWNFGLTKEGLVKYAEQAKVPDTKKFGECYDTQKYADKIRNDFDAGVGYSVGGTPTFFINGNYLSGAQPFDVFAAVIERELKAAGS
jgi:protein-disulfide isomerase